ncbi:MAG: cephalosporin hydroxylase [Rhodobiaceae bacterium]|nr:cephalosporin hydroxylase [Rhodobiaceae bacterium]
MDPIQKFNKDCEQEIRLQSEDKEFAALSREWIEKANSFKYSYHFSWMGRPIIQYPTDIIAIHEIIYKTKPNFIIETGIAHGGSVTFNASQMALLDLVNPLPEGKKRHVYAIDIDIREHNRRQLEQHPLADYFTLYQSSSTDLNLIKNIEDDIKGSQENIDGGMVILDSNHTQEHVFKELNLFEKFVGSGNYLVVFDTIIEFLEKASWPGRDWSKGNNPYTAVIDFLSQNNEFEIDKTVDNKIMFGVGPSGYLRKK